MKLNEKLEKGCGKEFIWIEYLKDRRICGRMEDLKHSEHIILCPECQAKLKSKIKSNNLARRRRTSSRRIRR